MDFRLIFNQLLVLFSLMIVGYFLDKLKIIDQHTNKKLSSFVVNVSTPALIIAGMADPTLSGTSINLFEILSISILSYVFLFLLTFFVPQLIKVPKSEYGIYKFMIMFSNVGFMGYPVITAIYGTEGIIYASIFNLPFNLLAFSLGVYFVSSHSEEKMKFNWKLFVNAGVVSVFIGLFFFITKIPLPMFVGDTITMVGDLTTPLAMLVIGASLANISIKAVFGNFRIYLFSFFKLIVFPIVLWLIFKQFPIDELLLGIAVVIVGMPVAANAVMLSKEYNGNEVVASEGVFMTTLFCILTIPLLVFILTL